MECSEFQESVVEIARGEAPKEAAEHAASCPKCAVALADQRALAAGLSALGVETRVQAPAHMQRVLAAVVAERRKSRLVPAWWYVAAAAGGALLLLIVSPFSKTPPPSAPAPAAVPSRRAAPPEPMRKMLAQDRPARAARRAPAPSGPVLEFEPLGYAAEVTPVESGQVVRVTLAAHNAPGDVVQADVLVGNDGIARAIRLVK